ncbi:MAG: beta-propeller domain-containing protein [Bifidobacteriaceae bacterium]|jgi:uncharacterized secreted protein with C-terminal beta-propeller domain|nr:beta-propeller domain-containing protein [Bifidobacteriaceae bacterium]
MNDPIFRAMRDQMRPSPELLGRLEDRLVTETEAGSGQTASDSGSLANPADATTAPAAAPTAQLPPPSGAYGSGHVPPSQTRRPGGRRASRRPAKLPLLATAAVAAVALVGTVVYATARGPRLTDTTSTGAELTQPVVASPADYSEVYAALEKAWRNPGGGADDAAGGEAAIAAGSEPGIAGDGSREGLTTQDKPEAVPSDAQADEDDYTGTNVQVEGIDEGDIVKTDGKTIFVASANQVVLIEAKGADTAELARIELPATVNQPEPGMNIHETVQDLILGDGVLAVVVSRSEYESAPPGVLLDPQPYWEWEHKDTTVVRVYDVSTPDQPELLADLGQDGYYQTARLADGKLYLLSNYWVPGEENTDPNDPATFTPCVSRDDAVAVLAPADLTVWERPTAAAYVVISAIDLAAAERVDQRAVLGGGNTVYMSHQNLYLSANQWQTDDVGAFWSQFGIGSGTSTPVTELIRVALDGGELTVAAEGAVPGTVVNQFALDEYESNLRVATTIASFDGSATTRSALFVLGPDLKVIGEIPELMRDESVQSVRFTGATGYVVTFRQTDPLFAIDLADPTAPKVMSALKITGFSAYLHPWGEGELIGLGYAGDETGLTGGLQLVLFDTSDPFDVSVRSTLDVGGDPNEGIDSSALWDHRAVFADPAQNAFGFPVRSWDQTTGELKEDYRIYNYTPATGFELSQTLELPSTGYDSYSYTGTYRGLRIGGFFYAVAPTVLAVYEGTSYSRVQTLAYAG